MDSEWRGCEPRAGGGAADGLRGCLPIRQLTRALRMSLGPNAADDGSWSAWARVSARRAPPHTGLLEKCLHWTTMQVRNGLLLWEGTGVWGFVCYNSLYDFLWGIFVCSVAQTCPDLCDPMDCSPPGFLLMGFLGRRLEWVAISFPRDIFNFYEI